MMTNKVNLVVVMLSGIFFNAQSQNTDVSKGFAIAEKQTTLMLNNISIAKGNNVKSEMVSPRTIDTTGNLVLIPSKDWCSDFFSGELWYLYSYTHYKKWLYAAKAFTAYIEPEKTNGTTHDMGFKIYCSFGNAYHITHDEYDKSVIIAAAKTLTTRFNPIVGCIKSWDGTKQWKFPVIIDNMMNLELLFEATRLSGDSSFYKTVSHANTTLRNHFRDDHSSYHIVDYDPETGTVLHKQTHQGYADGSAWARGQAWGLYGFTMCYRETHNKAYLQQAKHIADFIFNNRNMPADMVPYWDFNAPGIPNEPRDASTAAVMASALCGLSMITHDKIYLERADKIIHSLTQTIPPNPGMPKLLSYCTTPAQSLLRAKLMCL